MSEGVNSEVFTVTSEREAAMELVRQLQEEKEWPRGGLTSR